MRIDEAITLQPTDRVIWTGSLGTRRGEVAEVRDDRLVVRPDVSGAPPDQQVSPMVILFSDCAALTREP